MNKAKKLINLSEVSLLKDEDCYKNAELDYLTGCFTFKSFRENAACVMRKKSENNLSYFDIVYLNIERFRFYNEQYGFERGDELLKVLAKKITESFPQRIIARFSNDCFGIFTYDIEVPDAIQKLNASFYEYTLDINMSIKAGVYHYSSADTLDISGAVDCAKLACDSIRKRFDTLYRYYDQELERRQEQVQYIISHIDQAIEENWIKVYYQPVIRTLGREVCGMEALARWDDPQYGVLKPSFFIDILEEYHLIHKLDSCIVTKVCEDFYNARESGRPLVPVSFNLSRLDFELCDIVSLIDEAANMYLIPKDLLHIEITESILTENAAYIKDQVERFHKNGYEVWMDDFGSGYSSLNIFKDYHFDVIKIDMLFLKDFSLESQQIIASVVDMAKRIGVRTLAEGVETQEQLDFLRDIGCEKAQGFFIDKPEPYDMMCDHLRNLGYRFEAPELRSYHDDLGQVNFLGTNPLDGYEDLSRSAKFKERKGVPLGIFEFHKESGRFIYTNKEFRDALASIGIYSTDEAELRINDANNPFFQKCRETAESILDTTEEGYIDMVANNCYFTVRARSISSYSEGSAFLVNIQNISENGAVSKKILLDKSLTSLYSMFSLVDTLYLDEDTDVPVYMGANYYIHYGRQSLRAGIKAFAENEIHPDDRNAYLAFMNPDTIKTRLMSTTFESIDAFFRIHIKNDVFEWRQFILARFSDKDQNRVLFCIRTTNAPVMDQTGIQM